MSRLRQKLGILADGGVAAELAPDRMRFVERLAEMIHRRRGDVDKVAYRIGSAEPGCKVGGVRLHVGSRAGIGMPPADDIKAFELNELYGSPDLFTGDSLQAGEPSAP